MQFTGPQRTLILKGVMLYVLTEVGGADGAREIDTTKCAPSYTVTNPLPTSPVSSDCVIANTSSYIGCCNCDAIPTIFLQTCYYVAIRAISNCGTILIHPTLGHSPVVSLSHITS